MLYFFFTVLVTVLYSHITLLTYFPANLFAKYLILNLNLNYTNIPNVFFIPHHVSQMFHWSDIRAFICALCRSCTNATKISLLPNIFPTMEAKSFHCSITMTNVHGSCLPPQEKRDRQDLDVPHEVLQVHSEPKGIYVRSQTVRIHVQACFACCDSRVFRTAKSLTCV